MSAPDCTYDDAVHGRLAADQRCPACGVLGREHDRVCETCGERIAAAAVELSSYDGHLYCDDCWSLRLEGVGT